ncbi:class I SAM-dependent methyltransferase [Methanocella sp. CWC-04]|uniref:Class I SAM-dependent methyltransferase n=1 Tax=Methanooceanicella nereidis TaxID=2052831 RepID=A0AAP2W677_9EURY|nr:class I SAM-dependent methyltransferase [Methanocella sp. CWC-04]MCD1293786.1 class I SAM-dependent methyltransferase [Methanocella sp. CWC-04]
MDDIDRDPSKSSYLDMLASIGFAKHIGGKSATDFLIEKADIKPDSSVLDVGCGFGRTSCRLAKEIGCKVVGVDIMPKMIEGSKARAKKMGVEDRVTFLRCDARNLPMKSGTFDKVLIESVTIFMDDIDSAIAEYDRVTKPGGVICDNEVCITQRSMDELKDDKEDIESIFKSFSSYSNNGLLTYEGWKEAFEKRFMSVESWHHIADPRVEMEARMADGKLKAMISQLRSMWLYMTNPEVKKIMDEGKKMFYYTDHFGYGLFVCRKSPE